MSHLIILLVFIIVQNWPAEFIVKLVSYSFLCLHIFFGQQHNEILVHGTSNWIRYERNCHISQILCQLLLLWWQHKVLLYIFYSTTQIDENWNLIEHKILNPFWFDSGVCSFAQNRYVNVLVFLSTKRKTSGFQFQQLFCKKVTEQTSEAVEQGTAKTLRLKSVLNMTQLLKN